MNTKLKLDDLADFTWSFSSLFFLETPSGNYVWDDPEYGGDNTITPFNGSYRQWCKKIGIPFGRHKGLHIISEYCGLDVVIKD